MAKVIVTGAAGFIGSTLAEALLEQGHEVIGIDAFLPNYCVFQKNDNWDRLQNWGGFTGVVGDLAQLDLDRLVSGADVIFHQAALAGVRESWGEGFAGYLHNNVLTTQILLDLAVRHQIMKFIYASSSSVYGQQPELPLHEEMRPSPYSPYGVTKLAGEHLVQTYHDNFGLATVSLRYFTVYGPRQRRDMAIYRFIDAISHGREVWVYGDGNQTRDFTYVGDVVRANIAAWQALSRALSSSPSLPQPPRQQSLAQPSHQLSSPERPSPPQLSASPPLPPPANRNPSFGSSSPTEAATSVNGQVLNVGSGTAVTVKELIETIGQVVGRPPRIASAPVAPGDVSATLASINRIRARLGWRPVTPLREGLLAQYGWYQESQP